MDSILSLRLIDVRSSSSKSSNSSDQTNTNCECRQGYYRDKWMQLKQGSIQFICTVTCLDILDILSRKDKHEDDISDGRGHLSGTLRWNGHQNCLLGEIAPESRKTDMTLNDSEHDYINILTLWRRRNDGDGDQPKTVVARHNLDMLVTLKVLAFEFFFTTKLLLPRNEDTGSMFL